MGLRGGLMYTGITFYDASEEIISNVTWSNSNMSRQTPKYEIPSDQKIVGLRASTQGGNFAHMAFLLGKVDSAEIVGELEFPPMEEYPMPGDYESLYATDFRLSAIQYK